MKKTKLFFTFNAIIFGLNLQAQTPSLNSISNWSKNVAAYKSQTPGAQVPEISESDKREIGTFFLLHSMAQKGLIGKQAGICVNFIKGEEGSGDKITFGIQGSADNLGQSDCNSLPELSKATPIISQMGKFFANGCNGSNDCMSVNVTGYSDGVRRTGASSPNSSVTYNDDLAKKRAGCYEAPIKNAGISNFGQFNSDGRSSRYGQYLDIMNKSYGGDYKKFSASLKPEERAYFEPLYKKYGKNYKIKCDKRRVTVMDFEFKSNNAQFAQGPGVSGPSLYSGGTEFNKALFMDAAIQISAVTKDDLTEKNDQQLDSIMEKIMRANGVSDTRVIDSCKNEQSRDALKYFSARMKEIPDTDRQDFFNKVSQGNHANLLQDAIKNPESSEGKLFKEMTRYFGKSVNQTKMKQQEFSFPGLTDDGGVSSSPLNCFSANNAVQNMMATDPNRLAKSCKPVGHNTGVDGNLSVEFHPEESTHIGCDKCKSGLKFTKASDNRLTSYYDSRDPNFPNVGLNLKEKALKKYPFSPEQLNKFADELVNFEIDMDKLKAEGTYYKKGALTETAQKCFDHYNDFESEMKEKLTAASAAKKPKEFEIDSLSVNYSYTVEGTCKTIIKKYAKFSPETKDLYFKLDDENYQKYLDGYLNSKLNKSYKGPDYLVEYDKLQNPQYSFDEKVHNVLGLLQASSDKNSEFTLGGMKTPSYFILKNCDCKDPNLVQRVMQEGEWHKMDYMPVKDQVSSSSDACIVSLPVPTSCMVEINNSQQGTNGKIPDPKISWLDADGSTVESVLGADLSNFKSELDKLNSNFDFDNSCPTDDALAKAEAVVKSLGCDQNKEIQLPNPEDEFADCAE